jgi:hypothetical protein
VAHITVPEAQSWLETTKLTLSTLDTELEDQMATMVLGKLVTIYPTDAGTWTDATNTPRIVRKIISMYYAGWAYDKQYSETADSNDYANRLRRLADTLLEGIIDGTIDIIEVPGMPPTSEPEFFPTDVSAAHWPTDQFPSDGPPKFTMGQIFSLDIVGLALLVIHLVH